MADFTDEKTNKKSEALRDSVSGLQVPVPGERILSPSYLSLLQCVHLKKRTCMLPAAHTQLGLALVLAMSFLPPDLPSALATCLCPGLTWKDHIDGQPWQVTGRDGAGQRTANRLLPCKRGRVRVPAWLGLLPKVLAAACNAAPSFRAPAPSPVLSL